jgi:glycosyltransferase involved in cell wall biosynthesis
MRISFYAPMKSPTASTPSGDRRMARALIAALEHAGHHVALSSIFSTRDGKGSEIRQARLRDIGQRLAARLIRQYESGIADRPDLWFTYHVYYKAPDWIGPLVSKALGIPYVIAEASFAPKREGGAWAIGHDATSAAIQAADKIVGINSANVPCLLPLLSDPGRIVPLRPFMDTRAFEGSTSAGIKQSNHLDSVPVLLTTAMMRHGDKLASYEVLAEALAKLNRLPWRLIIIGDGSARANVETLMAPLGDKRVQFLGLREAEDLPDLLATADLFVWPAINEAYGMAMLEAQAAGIPVVAGNAGGVSEIVRHEITGLLTPEGNVTAFANAVNELVANPARRKAMGTAAQTMVADQHSLDAASAVLNDIVTTASHLKAA